jgi:hypothetical protein
MLHFIVEQVKKKNRDNSVRIIVIFAQKMVTKLSKIRVWDLGSGKIPFGSRIQGSKRLRIPDPDPQHCVLLSKHFLKKYSNALIGLTAVLFTYLTKMY